MVKTDKTRATEEDVPAARAYQANSLSAFAQDVEIWMNKKACINPMKVRGDGPTDKGRLWYRQFYNPLAKAAEIQARVNGRYVSLDKREVSETVG